VGSPVPRPRPNVRAADADRERTVEILRRRAGEGRLTPDELASRLEAAFAARTLGELQALIADLPEGSQDPLADLVTGVVRSGMRAARIGMIVAVAATVVGIALPLLIVACSSPSA
jgi:hypothetical protein